MAPTLTPRLQLSKPDPNDLVNVLTDLDANYDKIDLLGKNASPITTPFIKRNNLDVINSGTDSLLETITVVLKTNHWYEVQSQYRASSTVAITTAPTGQTSIRLKAGGSVAIGDPQIAVSNPLNSTTANVRNICGTTFDVPADGTYTLGVTVNSGGAGNTLSILASGGVDNTGVHRCFWVKDLGEK